VTCRSVLMRFSEEPLLTASSSSAMIEAGCDIKSTFGRQNLVGKPPHHRGGFVKICLKAVYLVTFACNKTSIEKRRIVQRGQQRCFSARSALA
jgi:hypothetical protein